MKKSRASKVGQGYPLALVALFGLCGCQDPGPDAVPSQGVTTESISADMHVSSTGGEVVTVETAIRQGNVATGFFIDLSPGDTLRASAIGDPGDIHFDGDLFDNTDRLGELIKNLDKDIRDVFGRRQDGIWYYTTFPASTVHSEFTVALRRASHNDAPRTTATLPPAFTITGPVAGQTFSRGTDAIPVIWSAGSADNIRLKGFVSCQNNASGEWSSAEIPDTGGYAIPAGTFNNYTGTCSISIGVERFRHGQLDPAFGMGGKIEAHQYRMVMINSLD